MRHPPGPQCRTVLWRRCTRNPDGVGKKPLYMEAVNQARQALVPGTDGGSSGAATRRVWPATCGEGDVLRLQDVVDSRRGIARHDHFLSRAKISTDDTTNDPGAPAGIRGRPMDRLLATLARPVSHRSFTEECVSEVAEAPLRVAICAIGAAVLPRCVRRSG